MNHPSPDMLSKSTLMRRRGWWCLLQGLVVMGGLSTSLAWAQTASPIRLLVGYAPGGPVDAAARLFAPALSRELGQSVVVENRPGGQNAIGAQAAARSPADGTNFYFATAAALVTNAYLFKSLPYDPRKDFQPVGLLVRYLLDEAAAQGSGTKAARGSAKAPEAAAPRRRHMDVHQR